MNGFDKNGAVCCLEIGRAGNQYVGTVILADGAGPRRAKAREGKIEYDGALYDELYFDARTASTMFAEPSFVLHGVTIGVNFHWERKEDQKFAGALKIIVDMDKLQAALGQDFLPETVVTGWDSALWPCVATVNNGDGSYTYEFRYAQTVDTMDGKDLELKPLFTSFTVPGKLTGAQMQTLKDMWSIQM